MLLVGRTLIGIAGRHRDAIDAERRHVVEERGRPLRVGIVEQRGVDRDAETLGLGQPDGRDGLVVDAGTADRLVVHLPVAIEVDGPVEIGVRLVVADLLLEKKRVRANGDELLAGDGALDDLRQFLVDERLAARHHHHGRTAFVQRPERGLDGDALVEDLVRIVDLAAARARQIAPEQRLQHHDEGIAFAATDVLRQHVGAHPRRLMK